MTGRNNEPERGGEPSQPSRLDQFGDTLASRNEEEFRTAAEQICETEHEIENQ
jgi:hypothetical protein